MAAEGDRSEVAAGQGPAPTNGSAAPVPDQPARHGDEGAGPIAIRAFDEHKPPEIDLIEDCVHCGFCLPTCPTYILWEEEMDSPRGRIVLMKAGLEGGSELSSAMVNHFDNCLGCMACVTSCPSGVQYDKLIEDTRAQVERNHERTRADRLFRRLIFEMFPHPGRLRAAAPMLAASRRLGLDRAAERTGLLERFPRLKGLLQLAPETPLRETVRRLPEVTEARGVRKGRVGLLQGCVQRVFFHRVNEATRQVLAAEGYEVYAPRLPRCCGALGLHAGYPDEGLATATIEVFDDCDAVVTNAAGCGSSMKDYGHMLRENDEWRERAEAFAEKVCDVSELLGESEPVAERHPLPLKVAYHDACHLAHAQGVRQPPRELLQAIPELELIEPPEWEICCGSAGVYNLVEPEPGEALGRRKAQNLLDSEAQAIASGNPGCSLQIAAHLNALGRPLPIFHPAELTWMSICGRTPG